MNMRTYFWVLEHVLDEHSHAVEHILFNPIFAPRPSGCRSSHLLFDGESASDGNEAKLERDVMADRQSLHEALKQMWKVLIFCDMAFREAGRTVDWEFACLNAICELFLGSANKLVGHEFWTGYEEDRKGKGSFVFYADAGKDSDTAPA